MLFENSNKLFGIFRVVFVLFLGVFVLKTGFLFFPDSEGYINMDIYRSLGYPLFLKIHQLIFGSFYLYVVVFSQFLLLIFSVFYFVNVLKKTFLKSIFFQTIVFVLLCVPVFYEFKLCNTIMSEALAYPLYLLCLSQLILGIFHKKYYNFYVGLAILFLLIAVRGQFLFLTIVFLVSAVLVFKKMIFQKNGIVLLLSILIVPFLGILLDIGFHSYKHNLAATTPWTGIQISTLPFFVANKTDSSVFENETEKAYFVYVFDKIEKKKLLLNQVHPHKDQMIFYLEKYTTICNGTINADGENFFTNITDSNHKVVANDKMSARMMMPLIVKNWQNYFKMYFKNVGFGFGTNKYFLMYLFLLAFSFFQIIKNKRTFYWIIFVGSLCTIGNIMIVSLAEPSTSRYVFYNNWVLITVLLVLFEQINSKQNAD